MNADSPNEFRPIGDEEVELAGSRYRVRPDLRFGPSHRPLILIGAHATVYQLLAQKDERTVFALKVLHPGDRQPDVIRNQQVLRALGTLDGFRACDQICFTWQRYPKDIARYRNLEFASLMPWVSGTSWRDTMQLHTDLTAKQCVELAYDLVAAIHTLERRGIAHCDLSGGNVLINRRSGKVNLVDFDDMYWPGAPRPGWEVVKGTPGYRKPEADRFGAEGDRFGVAVLLAELLGWADVKLRAAIRGDRFFTDDDCADPKSARYLSVRQGLASQWPSLIELLDRAWQASTSRECPRVAEWRRGLALAFGWTEIPEDPRDVAITSIAESPSRQIETAPAVGRLPLFRNWPTDGQSGLVSGIAENIPSANAARFSLFRGWPRRPASPQGTARIAALKSTNGIPVKPI